MDGKSPVARLVLADTEALADLDDHVVICNVNEKVRRIVEELHADTVADPPDVVLVHDEAGERLWAQNPSWHPRSDASREGPPRRDEDSEHGTDDEGNGAPRFLRVVGHPTSEADLREVHIARARAAVILADPALGKLADARSTLVAIAIERANPQVHTVMELIASVNRVHLESTEINEVVCRGEIAEKLIAQSCITPGIKQIFAHLLTTARGTEQVFLARLPRELAGLSYRALARRAIERGAPFTLLGFIRHLAGSDGRPIRQIVLSPGAGDMPGRDTALSEADELIAIADQALDVERWLGEDET